MCRNTVAVLITGGGEGTGGHLPDGQSTASTFLTVSAGRRVPIYVIAIAPPATAVAELQAIATNSGGQLLRDHQGADRPAAANDVAVPEMVSAITAAVQHGFAQPTDFNTAADGALPYGPQSEFQVTSPIVGHGEPQERREHHRRARCPTPTSPTRPAARRSRSAATCMITAGFAMPGFDGRLRAFRMYKPVVDVTKPSGYKFSQDGTALWLARTPMARTLQRRLGELPEHLHGAAQRHRPSRSPRRNAAALSPYMNTWDVSGLIRFVRRAAARGHRRVPRRPSWIRRRWIRRPTWTIRGLPTTTRSAGR